MKCDTCNGEGRVGNDGNQSPWSAYASWPPALRDSLRVAPIPCPACAKRAQEQALRPTGFRASLRRLWAFVTGRSVQKSTPEHLSGGK